MKTVQENNKSGPIYADYIKTIYDGLTLIILHTYTHNDMKDILNTYTKCLRL